MSRWRKRWKSRFRQDVGMDEKDETTRIERDANKILVVGGQIARVEAYHS